MPSLFGRRRGKCSDCNREGATEPLIQQETITCPYCWQPIEILLDLSADGQRYVEDCYVCCRPIVISYGSDGENLTTLEVAAETGE
jgi:hypothetical protein